MKMRPLVLFACLGFLVAARLAAAPQWELIGNPRGGRITSFAVKDAILFAATQNGGVFLSIDNGATWRPASVGLPAKAVCLGLAVIGADIFAGTLEHGVFRSTNNGGWWKAVNTGLTDQEVLSLAADGATLYAGTSHGVFRSGDRGDGWTAVGSGLPADFRAGHLVISNGNLAVGSGREAFLSRDHGATWVAVNSGIPGGASIFCLAVTDTALFAGTDMNGILVSRDAGGRWEPVKSKAGETEIHCLLINAADLFAGTGGGHDVNMSGGALKHVYHGLGVLRSTDNGALWREMNSGLRAAPKWPMLGGRIGFWVERLAANGSYLFAGTDEGEVWRLPIPASLR
jgi:hypothetical protein